MTDKATIALVVVWEQELRTASRLLHKLSNADVKEMPEAEYAALLRDALQACMVALWDVGDAPIVMLGADSIRRTAGQKP